MKQQKSTEATYYHYYYALEKMSTIPSYIGEAIDKEQRKMSNLFVSSGCDDSETVTDELAIIHPDNPRRWHNREVSKPYDYGHDYG